MSFFFFFLLKLKFVLNCFKKKFELFSFGELFYYFTKFDENLSARNIDGGINEFRK